MLRTILAVVLCVVVAVGLVGCAGESTRTLADTTVTVTLDGKPLEGATVALVPTAEGGAGSVGMTDAQGIATIRFPGLGAGAAIGEYKVAVSGPGIPETYGDENTSGIPPIKVVEGGDNNFKVEVKSK